MDIIFKGRRTEVQERFRHHASAKLGRIEKLDHKAIRVDVEVSTERNPRQSDRRERVELTIQSRGPVIRAEAAADDRYVALDRALAKLETRLRRLGERRKARRGAAVADRARGPGAGSERGYQPVTPGAAAVEGRMASPLLEPGVAGNVEQVAHGENGRTAGGDAEWPEDSPGADGLIPIQMEGDGPVVVREKYHTAVPMSIDQALLEMELVGHDFYLFRDAGSGHPSVVYRRHGYQYGLIRLVEEPGAKSAGQPGTSALARAATAG